MPFNWFAEYQSLIVCLCKTTARWAAAVANTAMQKRITELIIVIQPSDWFYQIIMPKQMLDSCRNESRTLLMLKVLQKFPDKLQRYELWSNMSFYKFVICPSLKELHKQNNLRCRQTKEWDVMKKLSLCVICFLRKLSCIGITVNTGRCFPECFWQCWQILAVCNINSPICSHIKYSHRV